MTSNTMTSTNTDKPIRHIYEQWHEMIESRNLDGLMKLYSEDSVLESTAVLVLEKAATGVLHGKQAIRAHFKAFFDMVGKTEGFQWYRPGPLFSDGKLLIWEYPSKSPAGQQLDVVESMDINDGLIVYHRVYWGWVSFKPLLAALNRAA